METNVKSTQDIRSDLDAIFKKYDYEGEVIDMLKDALTYSIYQNEVNAAVLGTESNPDFATSTNSKIKLALDHCYSIPRGKNCILNITLRRTSDKSIPRFQRLYSYQNYKVYLLDEIESGIIGSYITVRAIISKNIIQNAEASPMSKSSHIMTWTEHTDLSDYYYITDKDGNPVKTTTSMQEHIDRGYPMVMTDYDYSIRIMFRDRVYSGTDKYYLTAFPYCDYTPEYIENNNVGSAKDADMNDGFNRGIVVRGFTILSIQIDPAVLREDISDVTYISKYNLATLSRIRSMRDIERVFKEHFQYLVQECYAVSDVLSNVVNIYYILKSTASRDISELEWNLFKTNNIIKFIPADFDKVMCEKVSCRIDVTVHATEDIDKQSIVDYLESLNYSMNRTVRVSEIITKIGKLDPRIEYSDVAMYDNYEQTDQIILEDSGYLYFDDLSVTVES